MEALLKHAAIAWNPIGETRRRLYEGSLSLGAILVPFLAVVVACNLVAQGAQSFFFETLTFRVGVQMPEHPLVTNDFSLRLLSALGALVPAAAVAILPSGIFAPVNRGAAVASIVILAAAWAFYGAAVSVPTYFISGVLVTVDPQLGWMVFMLLSVIGTLFIFGIMIWFWFKVLRGVLDIAPGAVALISVCAIGSLAVVAGLLIMALPA